MINVLKLEPNEVSVALEQYSIMLHGTTGTGKALTLDTQVLTEAGYVPMADITIGTIVFDEDGEKCEVIGVYPQGEQEVYRVLFEDGSSVDCCKDHLWKYKTMSDVTNKKNCRIDSVETLLTKYKIKRGANYFLSIPVNKPIKFDRKELPISPYALGALLSDGCMTKYERPIAFSTVEKDIIDKLNEELTDIATFSHNPSTQCQYISCTNSLKEKLDALGLLGCYSNTKFIPHIYKFASIEQRLELLRGLIDTDGNVNVKGQISFFTSSKQLQVDFAFLVKSLGYACRVTEHTRENKTSVEYVVRICTKTNEVFTSIKHNQRYMNRKIPKRNNHYDMLKVVDIKKLQMKKEMQCIKVDSPKHTFICGDFIVTHNTTTMFNYLSSVNPDKKPLFLAFEDRHQHIPDILVARIRSMADLKAVIGQLKSPKAKEAFSCVVIDTIDRFETMCMDYITKNHDAEIIADVGRYGEGNRRLEASVKSIFEIQNTGFTVHYIAQSDLVSNFINNTEVEAVKLNKTTMKAAKTSAYQIGYLYIKDGERFVTFDKTDKYPDLKDSFNLPKEIHVDSLREVMLEGIKRKAGNKATSKHTIDLDRPKEDFEAIKARCIELGSILASNGRMQEAHAILQRNIGVDDNGNLKYMPKNFRESQMDLCKVINMELEELVNKHKLDKSR